MWAYIVAVIEVRVYGSMGEKSTCVVSRTTERIWIKFDMNVMQFEATLISFFLISYDRLSHWMQILGKYKIGLDHLLLHVFQFTHLPIARYAV
jgi:hypothetical protein